MVGESPRLFSPSEDVKETSVRNATEQSERSVERRPHVPHAVQLLPHPAVADALFIDFRVDADRLLLLPALDRVEDAFRGEHGALHGVVRPLHFRHVHETGRTAD